MYCEKCKKYYDNKHVYCDSCGEKLIEKNHPNNKPKKKSNKRIVIIILLVIIALALVISSTIFCFYSIYNYETSVNHLEYIKLETDKIPTIYKYNNSIKIDLYEKTIDYNEVEVEIEYFDNLYNNDVLDNYIKALEQEGFTEVTKNNGEWFLVKESNDNGKIILIEVYEEYDENDSYYSFVIEYKKINGKIDDYVETITYKRVGEEKYGYIDIDSKWEPYLENSNMIQYGTYYENLTLIYVENPEVNAREYMSNIYSNINNKYTENIKIEEVMVDGYKAYQLTAYYPKEEIYIAIWCFLDNNNIMHYIEIDSNNYNSKAFSQISSYSVIK